MNIIRHLADVREAAAVEERPHRDSAVKVLGMGVQTKRVFIISPYFQPKLTSGTRPRTYIFHTHHSSLPATRRISLASEKDGKERPLVWL